MSSRVFKFIEIPYILKRRGRYLFIFSSRPYWFSGNLVVYEIVKHIERSVEENRLIQKIARFFHLSLGEAKKSIEKVCDLLFDNSVLSIDSKRVAFKKLITPHFQVNRTESVLVIAVTNECNLHCPHCYASATKKLENELTLEEIGKIVDQVGQMPWNKTISQIGLTGGEFFTRKDALAIIEMIINKGFKIFLSTNALLLDDKKIKSLARFKKLEICVSLDGPDRQTHEFIRGFDTFNPTVKAIRKLCRAGIPLGINMFVHSKNFEKIENTLSLAASLGVNSFNCLSMMMVGRANSRDNSVLLKRVPEYMLYRKLFGITLKNKTYYQLMSNSTFANQLMGISGGVKSHYCGVGTNRALYVRSNGDLYPCPDTAVPSLFLGNLRKDNLKNIWENSKTLKKLRKLNVDSINPECSKCEVRYYCGGGCRGENYQITKSLTSPHFNCQEIKKSVFELMWLLTEKPDLYKEKVDWLYKKVKE